jgi:hypothetical protein
MKKNKHQKKMNQASTPIIDGDARPDQADEKRIQKKLRADTAKTDAKFSSGRAGDINSLEDFKDEK